MILFRFELNQSKKESEEEIDAIYGQATAWQKVGLFVDKIRLKAAEAAAAREKALKDEKKKLEPEKSFLLKFF